MDNSVHLLYQKMYVLPCKMNGDTSDCMNACCHQIRLHSGSHRDGVVVGAHDEGCEEFVAALDGGGGQHAQQHDRHVGHRVVAEVDQQLIL